MSAADPEHRPDVVISIPEPDWSASEKTPDEKETEPGSNGSATNGDGH
jgi:hypothetical protein